tara:strand:- start:314 stop:421 length:108 start_codon:yes stop_codon:yes gene_type:complete
MVVPREREREQGVEGKEGQGDVIIKNETSRVRKKR